MRLDRCICGREQERRDCRYRFDWHSTCQSMPPHIGCPSRDSALLRSPLFHLEPISRFHIHNYAVFIAISEDLSFDAMYKKNFEMT